MKKKIRVRFDSLKRADCFRLTLKGPIYMKDNQGCGSIISGRGIGRIWDRIWDSSVRKLVYQAKVKIVEVK